jgi:hypothetical protein
MEPDLVTSSGLTIEFKTARIQFADDLPVPEA